MKSAIAALIALALSRLVPAESNWPQFRGPDGFAVAIDGVETPVEFGPDKNVLWKTPFASGHPSPVLWEGRIFLTTFDRGNLFAVGLDQATGHVLSSAWPDNRLRRLTVRRHGFTSMHAGNGGGEFTTLPLTFSGKDLLLNYSTWAVGSLQVEIQDSEGKPLPNFSLTDVNLLFGDEVEAAMKWKSGKGLSSLTRSPVRLRFVMNDADLYSLKFR